jgi:hypothetical protein
MAQTFLTFGITSSGQWRSVYDVTSGRTELVCPWCKTRLIARKGNIKVHHFAHDGETCRISDEAVRQTQIPTFDTFELLDPDERQYLERRITYKQHRKVHEWPGMDSAIQRLSAMQIITVQSTADDTLERVKENLYKLGGYLDSNGNPNPSLRKIFNALQPLINIDERWRRAVQIESTHVSRDYQKNRFENINNLLDLERSQRYWLDAFWRRQSLIAPDYLEFLRQKFHALNQQNLYVMRFTGEFSGLPSSFLKIGQSSRDVDTRLREVLADLKPFGSRIKGEVLRVKNGAGRLERLLHRFFDADNLAMGSFREYFQENRSGWFIEQLDNLVVSEYIPPVTEYENNPVPGRRKKSNAEVLAEYQDVVDALESGKGIREISRETGRSVNTIQKVKTILAAP